MCQPTSHSCSCLGHQGAGVYHLIPCCDQPHVRDPRIDGPICPTCSGLISTPYDPDNPPMLIASGGICGPSCTCGEEDD